MMNKYAKAFGIYGAEIKGTMEKVYWDCLGRICTSSGKLKPFCVEKSSGMCKYHSNINTLFYINIVDRETVFHIPCSERRS